MPVSPEEQMARSLRTEVAKLGPDAVAAMQSPECRSALRTCVKGISGLGEGDSSVREVAIRPECEASAGRESHPRRRDRRARPKGD
jgi:hypothetical protein